MLITLKRSSTTPLLTGLLTGLLALLLAGCGGSNGGPGGGCTNLDPSRDPSLPSCGSVSGGGTTTGQPTLTLALTDGAGAASNSITPEHGGTLQVKVKDSKGVAQANVAVTFVTTDKTAVLSPSSGTALTDANGVASVGLAAGSVAGAYTATASATVGGLVTGAVSYAVTFKTLSLSALTFSPATLSAGGNASISVSVLSDGVAYTPPLPVTFSSPCVTAGKASLGSPVLTQAGVAVASYTDKGCGVADTVTASVTLGSATATKSGTLTVLPASAGSIKFVGAQTTNIALKGTGGFGRPEFSTLTFQVFDTTGAPVSGKAIDFVFADSMTTSTTGGLSLNPASSTSAADGTVTTLVTAGTIPTSVRVIASVHGASPPITTLSNILVISTGVPDQAHFSLATSIGNCEGFEIDQLCSVITATVGDHFGNPVPDGTAVNFTTESGIIDASCVTGSLPASGATPGDSTAGSQTTNSKIGPGSGTCSVNLRSAAPRKANGRVTVMAYALGEETLIDNNGNNVYDSGDNFIDKSPDIFRDDDENGRWSAGEPCIGPNTNGSCSTPGDGIYNGVLRKPQTPSAQTQYVSAQFVEIFSGSHASITFTPSTVTCNDNLTALVGVTVKDQNGNVMPYNSQMTFGALFGLTVAPVLPASAKVENVRLGIGQPDIVPTYPITIGCPSPTAKGVLNVTVTTPGGTLSGASININ
ncbi:hypothetical protein [Rugamonas apoptosis]|uniref:Big-1 domain-containing protein n=1 Tax=Rugamonas apoptosis TaxID=2758570 RepID=A0A7W2F6Y0_9BURK|nr:hypothetical protein [Rugamonas apoptosis]MBA5686228.1 hypothetical protein [Rugamonas apoptosis]